MDTCIVNVRWPLSVINTQFELKTFPNPVKEKLTIIKANDNKAVCSILNVYGQLVVTQFLFQKESIVDFSELETGMYFLILKEDNAVSTVRIIKE